MKEQRITDAERVERIDKLEARIRLEVDGALHRHLCCKGMDASVSEALQLLAEGFAVASPKPERPALQGNCVENCRTKFHPRWLQRLLLGPHAVPGVTRSQSRVTIARSKSFLP